MTRLAALLLTLAFASPAAAQADPARLTRIRAAKMPAVTAPVPFDTPEADAILAALEVFPPDNAWNQLVEAWPLHPDSKAMVASIGATKPLRANPDMGFVLVPPTQVKVPFKVTQYPDEADHGPFPIPDGVPIEGWPAFYQRDPERKKMTLDDVQRDRLNLGGDRHAIVVDPVSQVMRLEATV